MATICCSPPLMEPTVWREPLPQAGEDVQHALERLRPGGFAAGIGAELQVLADTQCREGLAAFGYVDQPGLHDVGMVGLGDVLPVEHDSS